VRTVTGSQNTLNWVMTDQISSTTVTASADGGLNSEIRYTAFGTIRYENGITHTDYRYTPVKATRAGGTATASRGWAGLLQCALV